MFHSFDDPGPAADVPAHSLTGVGVSLTIAALVALAVLVGADALDSRNDVTTQAIVASEPAQVHVSRSARWRLGSDDVEVQDEPPSGIEENPFLSGHAVPVPPSF